MAEQITSLVITKIAPKYWIYTVNDEEQTRDANAYTGTRIGDYITIKTVTGAPQALRVYFADIQYIDNLDPDNNLTSPSNPQEVQGHLISQGFYTDDTTGGGTGGVDIFKLLLDVAVPSFAGRAGQVLKINDDETFIVSEFISFVQKFQDLSNWLGGEDLVPNRYILTSSQVDEDGNSIGLISAPISQIINRPFLFNEAGVTHKGATIVSGEIVANEEQYTPEIGDAVTFFAFDEPTNRLYKYIDAKWLGGSMDDPLNYDWGYRTVFLQL